MLHLIMVISALIMTSVWVFGEFIQKALQDTGRYSARLVESPDELIGYMENEEIQVVILDVESITDSGKLVRTLKSINPDLAILLFNDRVESREKGFYQIPRVKSYDGVLRMPELREVLENLTAGMGNKEEDARKREEIRKSFPSMINGERPDPETRQAPSWMGEVNGVAQILTRLTLESAAHAALITRDGKLWAYAGHLSRPAAEELAQSVWHYWDHDGGSDLARFIRLEANQGEYMLYATGLGGEYLLGLAFEAAIPFSEMRMQAGKLAKKLITPPSELQAVSPGVSDLVIELDESAGEHNRKNKFSSQNQPEKDGEDIGTGIQDDWHSDEEGIDDRQAFFEDLLKAVEIPNPDGVQSEISDADVGIEVGIMDFGNIQTDKVLINQDTGKSVPHPKEKGPNLQSSNSNHEGSEGRESLGETWEEIPGDLEMDPTFTITNELGFGCVLVTRIPHHKLTGDLAFFVKIRLRLCAVAYGWRLEHLVIKPDLIHWVAVLSPDHAPGQMVKDLRLHSSKDIFSEYPHLCRDNPSGDFWAPGCLIVAGKKALPGSILRLYLEKTRERQGIKRTISDDSS